MKAVVKVQLKKGILDPQGKAVNNALHHLGFTGIHDVRIGKFIELNIEEEDRAKAREILNESCRKLLANPVIEDYSYEFTGDDS
jgi:phosphoribosylformylglycinamidine synthase PurS subunit